RPDSSDGRVLVWCITAMFLHRDFSNGNLLAKIFSQYYPRVIATHNFINGTSLSTKMSNWYHLQQHLVNGTLHCKPGAAEALVFNLFYTIPTEWNNHHGLTWTSQTHAYQRQLPLHARATASQTLKNNIRNSELLAEPGQQHMQRKAQALLLAHQQQRREERRLFPGRFNIKPTMAELAIRLH
uniref:Spermatogenesis associated 4 n=1 Tax=Eptatretus burgeri TaxID=7764 RepID=A0A8C4QH39_EPTBU